MAGVSSGWCVGTSLESPTAFEGAHLDGAHLDGAHLDGAHLDGAHLDGAHPRRALYPWLSSLPSEDSLQRISSRTPRRPRRRV
ncbi:MAG: pentapeptide repeat-containing protein [Acidobacteriota bacterium]|nr:pentapeptide repeat-containing protein [Acidobacteriota bacterium]